MRFPAGWWRVIYKQEAELRGVTVEMMLGTTRIKPVVEARWRAWSRMVRELGMSPSEIGRRAHRHHTTVGHALERTKITARRSPISSLSTKDRGATL